MCCLTVARKPLRNSKQVKRARASKLPFRGLDNKRRRGREPRHGRYPCRNRKRSPRVVYGRSRAYHIIGISLLAPSAAILTSHRAITPARSFGGWREARKEATLVAFFFLWGSMSKTGRSEWPMIGPLFATIPPAFQSRCSGDRWSAHPTTGRAVALSVQPQPHSQVARRRTQCFHQATGSASGINGGGPGCSRWRRNR